MAMLSLARNEEMWRSETHVGNVTQRDKRKIFKGFEPVKGMGKILYLRDYASLK